MAKTPASLAERTNRVSLVLVLPLCLLALLVFALVAPAALAGSGTLAWPTAGVPAFSSLGWQGSTATCPDGAGGVIVVSSIYGNGNDLYAQRVAADGTKPWGDTPKLICNADNNQDTFVSTSDGAGGVIVVWQDDRNAPSTASFIYAQRLNADGTALWAANGVLVDGTATYYVGNSQPQVLADGSGGAVVTWLHGASDPCSLRAQHLNAAGAAQWGAGGVIIAVNTDDPNNQDPYEPTVTAPGPLTSDGAGGAMVTFLRWPYDNSTGNPHPWCKVYVVRVEADGDVPNVATPTAVADIAAPLANYQYLQQIVYDGAGNALVAWIDMRHKEDGTPTAYETDLYAQKVRVSDGARLWAADGQPLCTAPAYQNALHLVAGSAGSAVAVWEDHAYDSIGWGYPFVCANRIDTNGATQWGASSTAGVRVLDIAGAVYEETVDTCSDGAGGAYVAWPDARNTTNAVTESAIYGQHIGADGSLKWGTNKEGEALWYGPHDSAYAGTPMVVCTSDGALGAAWGVTLPAGDTPASVVAQKVTDSAAEIVPHVDSVSPASVVANGTFTVRGIHLGPFVNDNTTKVLVNGAAASRDTWRDSWVKAVLPPGLEGIVDVTVQTARGTSNAVQLTVTRPAPVEYGCTPSTGPVGTAVDLRGDYFGLSQAGSSGHVQFFNTTTSTWTEAAVTSWTYRHIYLTVPAGLPNGWAAVRVITDKGTATGSNFNVTGATPAPSIATLTPSSGGAGTSVQIDGANFGATKGASTVTFGGVAAATTAWADTQVTATVPAGLLPGPATVIVTVGGVASGAAVFTVTAPPPPPAPAPTLATLSPTSGAPRSTVLLSGSDFGAVQGSSSVRFGALAATATSWSATSITCVVPAGASGSVAVTVTTPDGTSAPVSFRVKPLLTGLSPGRGQAGVTLTIKGAGFGPTRGKSVVKVGSKSAGSYVSWSNTKIKIKVPKLKKGAKAVTVTVSGATSNSKTFKVI